MPYIDANGARLFYTDEGEGGFTLLLMHGLSADSNDWVWIVPQLRRKFRIIAVDLRGHGHSTDPGQYALRDFVDDAVELVKLLGVDSVVPVGHSLGGAIAAAFAVEHPELVRAVVEVDPAYALPQPIVQAWEAGRAHWLALKAGQAVDPPPPPPRSPVTPDFLETLLARRREAMDPAVLWAAFDGLAYGPGQMFAASEAADAYLRRRACPVLSIHSLPGRAQWESGVFTHPQSRAIEWEGSSHFFHIERYRELAFVIDAWLEGIAAGESRGPTPVDAR